MIKLVEKIKSTEKREPFYTLEYHYMIGDGNGDTTEVVRLSEDNPYIERYCKLLLSLEPTKGHWGIVLNKERIWNSFQEGQITEDDYFFLRKFMFEYDEDDEDDEEYVNSKMFKLEPENENYSHEFYYGVMAEAEYSFLVFQGLSLIYHDEYGEIHDTYFV